MTLIRNEEYWGQKAYLETVILRVIPDNSARYLALKSGEIHGMEGATAEDAAAAKTDPALQVLLRPAMNVGTILFNNTNTPTNPFANVNVRKALAMSIDKEAIVKAFYGATGLVANQFLPPSLWGYNKDLTDYPFDVEAAKTMLTEAGYSESNKLTFDFWYMINPRPYFPDPKGIAEAIAADWSKTGLVNVTLKTEDWSTYLADRVDRKVQLLDAGLDR